MQFDNQQFVITGATSGMGESVARMLHSQGANLMITGRSTQHGQAILDDLNPVRSGQRVLFSAGDVSSSAFADELIREAEEAFGVIDGLVNAAGMIHRGTSLETTDGEWRTSFATNVDGTFFMSRAVLPAMLRSSTSRAKGGSIVNFGSTCALVGSTDLAAYCASKGAIIQLTRAMALDHANEGVRINAVCPGAVDTPMLMSGRERVPKSRDEVHAMNLAEIPQKRIPQADEIAELVCFLLGDASRHITGTSIPIDGGYTAQ